MGRALKYKSVQALQQAIDAYFADCEGEVLLDASGQPVLYKGVPVRVGGCPPTVTGLAYALGFSSRQALLNYQGRKGYHDAVTRAKLYIESRTEERLFDRDGARGAQFSLEHNFRWQADTAADTPDVGHDGLLQALAATGRAAGADGDDTPLLPGGASQQDGT